MTAANLDEEWRNIPGREGSYQISSHGRIRSLDRMIQGRGGFPRSIKGQIIKPRVSVSGYAVVLLSPEIKSEIYIQRTTYIAHLVALAFIGPRPEGHEVAHKDGNKLNNRSDNLRYATPKENAADKALHGTQVRGEKCHSARLTESAVREIRRRATTEPIDLIRADFNISISAAIQVIRRITWKHV